MREVNNNLKALIAVILMIPILLVGCGQAQNKLLPGPAWVSAYMAGKPTVYYVATDEKVQTVGKLIIELTPNAPDTQGPGGWASPYVTNAPVEVNAIPGVDETKAVAIKFSKSSPYVKAVAQSNQP